MSDELNPLDALQLESERTLFMFYGYRKAATGERGQGYFKLAHSLAEAIADLMENEGVLDEGGFLVRDAIVTRDDDGEFVVNVELVSLTELFAEGQR